MVAVVKRRLILVLLVSFSGLGHCRTEDDDDDNSRTGFMAFQTFRPLWDTPGIEDTTKVDKDEETKPKKSKSDDKEDKDPKEDKDQFVSNADFLSEFNQPTSNFNPDPFRYPQPNPCMSLPSQCPPPPPYSCGCPAPPPPAPRCVPRFCPPPPLCPPPPPPVFCPPPPPCMPRPCPPPPPLPPPPPMPSCSCIPTQYIPPNDCCANCHRPCKMKKSKFMLAMQGTRTLTPELEQRTAMCNSYILRNIIGENISHDIDQSKRSIQFEAEKQLGKPINVICGHGEFSFTIHTDLYCQYSFYEVSCYAYQQ